MTNMQIKSSIKPMGRLGIFRAGSLNTIGVGAALSNNQTYYKQTNDYHSSDNKYNCENKMNLYQFSRLFKIGGVPFMDFVTVYILLYISNNMYFNICNEKILVSTIPATVLFNYFIHNKPKNYLLVTSIICIIYLFLMNMKKQ